MKYRKNIILDNIILCLIYWGLSHLNWLIFSSVGVLPMPVWPAAGVAFVAAFYRGWKVAPGLALGAFLANYISLSAPLSFALLIPVMNTLGPVLGGYIARRKVSLAISLEDFSGILLLFVIGLLLVPALTATGGIGFNRALGFLETSAMLNSWLKWLVAHSLGTLLVGLPLFAWVRVSTQNRDSGD